MQQKPFAWSFSRASAFELCPKRHYEIDIAKNFSDGESEALLWGSEVHGALAAAVLHTAGLPGIKKGRDSITPAPLPDSMKGYQPWINTICTGENQIFVEQQFAVTRDYKPTGWFDSDVWLRCICDLLVVKGNAAHAFDWKTGKIKHDSRQLAIVAKCVFAHYPEVDKCKTRFIWLKDGTVSFEQYDRTSIMRELTPALELAKRMEVAAVTNEYPPNPGGLCFKHCPILTCQYHGKRIRNVA
jgi:hypothetical protein